MSAHLKPRELCELAGPGDADLLARYAATGDPDAFAALVRRHARTVLGACRRVLADAHAAEDAFQATFLQLARKAGGLRHPAALPGWLYRTARRTALRHRPPPPPSPPDPPPARDPLDVLTARELLAAVEAEIARLPRAYRLPLVLCYLDGLPRDAAADRLGVPPGVFRGRLDRGRERLRAALTRRGLAPAAALGAFAPAPVAADLVARTVSVCAKGERASAAVAALAAGRVGLPTTAGLAVGLLVMLGGLALVAAPAQTDPPSAKKAQPPAAAPPGDRLGDPLPVGAVARLGTRRTFGPHDPRWAAFSPDGSKIAAASYRTLAVLDAATGRRLVERDNYWFITAGWRADGAGVAVVRVNGHHFVSAFTDAAEKLPDPPPAPDEARRSGPDGLDFVALAPDATRLAVVRTPGEGRFTVDVVSATVGRLVSDMRPTRTLGPFPGPCREVRFTARGVQLLTGALRGADDWTLTVVDPDRNAVVRTTSLPPPAYCVWGYMYSLSVDARFAALPVRPAEVKAGRSFTNAHDGTLRVWDLEAGKELASLPFPDDGYGTGHAFTQDGKRLVVADGHAPPRLWDVATGKEVARRPRGEKLTLWQGVSAVAASTDGKRVATAQRDGRVVVRDAATLEPIVPLETHRDDVLSVSVAPDGRLAATFGLDDTVRVWETETGRPVRAVAAPGAETSRRAGPGRRAVFTPDGRGLLFTADGKLALADPLTGQPRDLPGGLRGKEGIVGGFSADGKSLATHAGDTVTVWDWPAGAARVAIPISPVPGARTAGDDPQRVRGHLAPCLSPDGGVLFTNSVLEAKDGAHQNANDLWDARTGKRLHRTQYPEYPPAAFSPDGRTLYLGGHSLDERGGRRVRADALTAWDPAAGTLLRRFTEPERPRERRPRDFGWQVVALALSPDGRILAAADEVTTFDGVWLYDAATGRPLKKFVGHLGRVADLAFTPDGRRLVSVGQDQTGLVWDVTGVAP